MKKDELKYRAYALSLRIVRFVSSLPKNKIADVLGMQILRSGTSIGANVIEAQSGSSKKDFTNFYAYALKSANETKFWFCLLRDSKIATESDVKALLDETVEIAKIIARSILTMRANNLKT